MSVLRFPLRALFVSSSMFLLAACGDFADEPKAKSSGDATQKQASSDALQECPKLKLTGGPGPIGPGPIGAEVAVAGGAWWGPWGGFGGAWGKAGYGWGLPGKWWPAKLPPGKVLPPPPPPGGPVPPPPPPPPPPPVPGPGGQEPYVPVTKGDDGVTLAPSAQPQNQCLTNEASEEGAQTPTQK